MTSTDRRYLRARKVVSPAVAARETALILDEWRTLRLKTALGRTFRQTERVVMRRPGWMPRWLYLRLLRSIVYEAPAEGETP